MSCGGSHETPCKDVLSAVLLFIDGEIEETSQVHSIEIHLQECPPCKAEMEHERKMHEMLHDILTRSCCEPAPLELHELLHRQLSALRFASPDQITELTQTQISIHIENFGQIDHHEITFESTQEFRLPPNM